ncbi:MAG: hypothetical protein RIC51_07450 [Erythrobacter sp.]|uniref:hypothetical protein n=1 Tax=Erythrobacter sp. TaxID=1042 RepID=UPI0032EE0847
MIETQSNLDAVIDRLKRHAEQLRTVRAVRRAGSRIELTSDWRSAASLWPGFAQD